MSASTKQNTKSQNDSRVNIKAIRVKGKLKKKISYGSYYLDIMILRLISRLSLVEVKYFGQATFLGLNRVLLILWLT